MKCPICKKGKMKIFKDKIKKDKIGYEALKCSECEEEVITMKQLNKLGEKYKKLSRK